MLLHILTLAWFSLVNVTLCVLIIRSRQANKVITQMQEQLLKHAFALQDLDEATSLLDKKLSKRSPAAQRFYQNNLTFDTNNTTTEN